MPRKKQTRDYGKYIEKIGGVLYASVNIPLGNGKYEKKRKRYNDLGGTPNDARQWALAQLSTRKHEGVAEDKSKLTFRQAAEWYKKHFLIKPVYENNYKIEGVKDWEKLRNKTDRMIEYFGDQVVRKINDENLRQYARYRRETDDVVTATINRDFALMRKMFREWRAKEWITKIPKFPINIHAEIERDRIMSIQEERLLIAACESEKETITVTRKGKSLTMTIDAKREHLKPIIMIAVDTAMRLGEILKLVWKDINFEQESITVQFFNSKTQKSRMIGMTPRIKAELLKLYEASDKKPDSIVFTSGNPHRAFMTACDRAGIKDLRIHDLRHTGTTRMVRAGIPHAEVMKITGHTQIKTFLRYLNLNSHTVQINAAQLAKYMEENSIDAESESLN